jgi:hypothetical protein
MYREAAMPKRKSSKWPEVESEVHRPTRLLMVFLGIPFLLTGTVAFVAFGGNAHAGMPRWLVMLLAGATTIIGAIPLVWGTITSIFPAYVRHAAFDVMPDVPTEPVTGGGSSIHGSAPHKLVEDAQGWQLRPVGRLLTFDQLFMLGFGIPFLALCATLTAWEIHGRFDVSWLPAALLATTAVAVCGGPVIFLASAVVYSSYQFLCRLSIPHDEGDLLLDCPRDPDLGENDLMAGLKWKFVEEKDDRQQLTIPRQRVAAVQLCPWKYKSRSMVTWAVQGSVVMTSKNGGKYDRLPIVLTSDFVGAARLMQRVANVLQVPYLFCADKEGWQAEG